MTRSDSMTDLEMTRLCAEAMGLKAWMCHRLGGVFNADAEGWEGDYDPLDNYAQAMALVKKLGLKIIKPRYWVVSDQAYEVSKVHSKSFDLNRAIVECVAKMRRKA